jgi:DNA-binding transcriptional regulator/RsmH inhibitor MraZ
VVTGINNNIELWAKERWTNEKATSQEEAGQIIETLDRR